MCARFHEKFCEANIFVPTFAYKAKKDTGEVVTGSLVAESEQAAVSSLDRMQLFPLELVPRSERVTERWGGTPALASRGASAGKAATPGQPDIRGGQESRPSTARPRAAASLFQYRRRIRAADTALFSRQLADLLKAGINLNRALGTLTRQTSNPQFAEVVAQIQADVAAGTPLADALERHPRVFTTLYASMVRAGETGGFLEDVLQRSAIFAEKEQELRGRITSALIYPTLLVVVGISAVAFLLTFFIPRFALIFKDLGGQLPGITRAMLGLSELLAGFWWAILAVLLFAVLAFWRWRQTPQGRLAFDRLKLRVPALGDVLRKTAVARFTRTLGTLLKSGVPILTAIDIAKEALGNAVLQLDAAEAAAAVKEGRSLAEPLARSPHFPPVVVDMIAVGDESGNLDDVLIHVADTYDREVDRAVRVFVSLLEPVLLMFMAVIVGLIVISMLLPVFSLNAMVK